MSYYTKKRKSLTKRQKTRYYLENVLVPDELVLPVKRNFHQIYDPNKLTADRLTTLIFGLQSNSIDNYHNLTDQLKNFRQLEILSGSLTVYIIPAMMKVDKIYRDTYAPPSPGYTVFTNTWGGLMIGSQTHRNWLDEDNDTQSEIVITPPDSLVKMWNYSAEKQGYRINFLKNGFGGGEPRKFKWKIKQSDFKDLKTNKTGFQQNLPISSVPPFTIPQNNCNVTLDFSEIDAAINKPYPEEGCVWHAFYSHKLLLKLKGRNKE